MNCSPAPAGRKKSLIDPDTRRRQPDLVFAFVPAEISHVKTGRKRAGPEPGTGRADPFLRLVRIDIPVRIHLGISARLSVFFPVVRAGDRRDTFAFSKKGRSFKGDL